MKKEIAEIEKTCREIKERRTAQCVTVDDLDRCEQTDKAIRRLENAEHSDAIRLRAEMDNLADVLGGAIQSRLDSHYWDRGFLELESEREIIYAADGYALVRAEDDDDNLVVLCIPPEEIRTIGGAPPD